MRSIAHSLRAEPGTLPETTQMAQTVDPGCDTDIFFLLNCFRNPSFIKFAYSMLEDLIDKHS